MSKQLNSRVSHKHDTEANWLKATSFVPLAGEQIIYDADDTHPLPRVKIGDGTTLVSDLPFAVKNTTPNWKASEGEDGYIENRTHWKEEGLIDVLPENAPMYSEDSGSFFMTERFVQKLVEGDSYTVIWNGEPYECTANKVNVEVMDILCLGNMLAMDGEDSGEPFFIGVFPDDAPVEYTGGLVAQVMPLDESTEVTIKIQHDGVLYHKLDPGYMPFAMTGGTVDVLPETTIELGPGESSTEFDIIEPLAYKIEIGKQYKVTHNGAVFTCTAKEMDLSEGAGEMFTPALGNLSMIPGNESQESMEPFVFFQIPSEMYEEFGSYAALLQTEEAHSAVIGIQSIEDVKIDNSALDLDWIPKKQKAGETIVERTLLPYAPVYLDGVGEEIFELLGDAGHYIAFVDGVYYRTGVLRLRDNFVIIGNPRVWSMDETIPDTGEPFVFILSDEGFMVMIKNETPGGVHEVALYHEGNAQTLPIGVPRDLMPDMTPLVFRLGDSIEQPVAEIQSAFRCGRAVYVIDSSDYVPLVEISGQAMTFRAFRDGEEMVATYDESQIQRWSVTRTSVADLLSNLTPKCTTISIPSASWTGDTNPYSQVVTVNGATANSKIDLQPTAAQIVQLQDADIALMAENNNGVITVYAIGGKPATDLTMQVLITEVQVV